MHTLIIGNGEPPLAKDLRDLIKNCDLIIATDGAANTLPEGVSPHIICGDFDSIDSAKLAKYSERTEIIKIEDQSLTDLEKGITIAEDRGMTRLTLCGFFGRRIDHSFGTISTMLTLHSKYPVTAKDDRSELWIISPDGKPDGTVTIEASKGDIISLAPLSKESELTITNVEWPLTRTRIRAGTQAISNRALGGKVIVTAHEGVSALCHLHSSWRTH